MKRRSFSAEFKTKVVLEAISGEGNKPVSEHSIALTLFETGKMSSSNASSVFDTKRDAEVTEKLREIEDEKEELTKKVGQLTMQVDWLKKKSEETFGSDWESKFSPRPKGFK